MSLIDESVKGKIISIWNHYKKNSNVSDIALFEDIDNKRLEVINEIREIISVFIEDKLSLLEFKSTLDSVNRRNNLWGFTAAKGQFYLNRLTKSSENNIAQFTKLLQNAIVEPTDIQDALKKIKTLFDYAAQFINTSEQKRKAANPKSSAYFLSYFWQIYNYEKWPIMYTSLIVSFQDLGIWQDFYTAQENYKSFYILNEEIRQLIEKTTNSKITNWDLEHAFWKYAGTASVNSKQAKKIQKAEVSSISEVVPVPKTEIKVVNPGFELNDYIIPRVNRLVELGSTTDKTSSAKGRDYERMVAEVFELLGFEVNILGQGSGREPDAIIKYREDHSAFIVDAKAYSAGYSLGTDDRAIKEYISHYCPRLKQEGFNKIGFIIVSNSFKSDLSDLINVVTWTTDIKRFILITSEALLFLLAYKIKDRLTLSEIIESIIKFKTVISKDEIIEQFGDY